MSAMWNCAEQRARRTAEQEGPLKGDRTEKGPPTRRVQLERPREASSARPARQAVQPTLTIRAAIGCQLADDLEVYRITRQPRLANRLDEALTR
ncbi:unnamed protein product [Protopolystoma xenopodis]|uniref:Uncharacterized protein n=1 Tax=Protopolystoma xenopodis TaxID=117903 RepID=A0A448WR93_9PLAT|nr:unnamed protein product [Protopolystoma xenopodis]